jgi:hypothetical protein
LWNDATKQPRDVKFIHHSKFVRNALTSKELFAYIFEDLGGNSWETAELICPATITTRVFPDAPFERVRDLMKSLGPALVQMFKTHGDLQVPKRFRYSSKPEGSAEGHAMLLVGVRRDKNNEVFFLMQNFWEGKQFLELRMDYFIHSEGEMIFFDEPDCQSGDIYAEKVGTVRFAKSSGRLERADEKVVIRLRQEAN